MKHFSNLILASKSPRRKQLLQEAGFEFEVKTIDFDETFPENLASGKVAEYLAVEKNKAHRAAFGEGVIITADTVVIFSDKILGKPQDEEEARRVLKILSGKIHQVVTGVCISSAEKQVSFSNLTEVKFHELSDEEIAHYIQIAPPLDKAGSYGIQDWIGLIGVEWIRGSYFNVVGLPVDQVYKVLKDEFSEIHHR
ncbi:MAG: Maf family nucleotide pyrophosphatase [Ekhidna sp.]|uniref:Maf family nucleotide pyrophosphatase n=1 Tax=Ekhidna sp. TaxID=2608089 RepID=UPI0032EBE8C8